jgi:hypothetical protein
VSRRNQILLVAVAAVAGVAAYWMLALAPKREEATKLSQTITTKRGELKAAEAELATYEKAKAGYKANYSLVARLGKAVPADDDVRSMLVQLNAAAGRSKVDFRTIQVGGSGAAALAAPAAPAASSTDSASTDKKDSAATGAAATPAAPATPPAPGSTPVGSAGFSAMPFTFSFRGSFFNLGAFFQRLDRFVAVNEQRLDVTGRLMLLNNISLAPDTTGFPRIRAQIGATTYMLPATQGLTAGASPAGPTGTAPAASGAATPAPGATTPPTTTAAIGATR